MTITRTHTCYASGDVETKCKASCVSASSSDTELFNCVQKETNPLNEHAACEAKAQDFARAELTRRHFGLVKSTCWSLARTTGLDFDDLVQEGSFGLLRSIELFDTERGVKFSTYATSNIRYYALRGATTARFKVHFPVHIQLKIFKLKKAQARLTSELGRDISLKEAATITGILEPDQAQTIFNFVNAGYLSEQLGDDVELWETLVDFRSDSGPTPISADLILAELKSPRTCEILKMRYGVGQPPKSLAEVAEELGISRERVRQIENAGIAELRVKNRGRDLSTAYGEHPD